MNEQMEHKRREQIQQLKDKIEQLKRAQVPAPVDAGLVEKAIDAYLAVAADALLGPGRSRSQPK